MSLKKTLAIGVILLTLLGFIFFVEKPKEKAMQDAELLYPGLQDQNVEGISIDNFTGKVALTRDGDSWKTGDLGYSSADKASVEGVISALKSFEIKNEIPADEVESDLKIYGLDKPAVSISATIVGQISLIRFGKKNEFTGRRYAQIEGKKSLFFVMEDLFNAANKSVADFKDKTPIDFENLEVATLKIKSSKRNYEFAPTAGQWRAIKPMDVVLSNQAVSSVLLDIKNISAGNFYNPTEQGNPKESSFGLEKPVGTVEISFKNPEKEPLVLSFGIKSGDDKQDYLKVSSFGSIFGVPSDTIDKIFKDFDSFREKNPISFSEDAVTSISFIKGDGSEVKIEQIKDSSGAFWKVNGEKAENAFASTLVKDLADLRVESYVSESRRFGFEKPTIKVQVNLAFGEPKERALVVGDKYFEGKALKGYFAASGDMKEPFVISEHTLKRITPNLEALLPIKQKNDITK
jgi:hypothetical protein